MNEGLSLAGMIEAPLVLDIGMRAGPATGMPTYTEQGELLYVIHAGHGEFPRIVLAPADADEAFRLTMQAFELADRYQVPVFVMTDKYLNESQWCVPVSVLSETVPLDRGKLITGDTGNEAFLRYDTSAADGVSPRSVPGTKNGVYYANSYEHDGKGHVADGVAARTAMVDKRARKVAAIAKDIIKPVFIGDQHPDILFVTWGTTRNPVLAAAELMRANGRNVSVVSYPWVYPFPIEETKAYFADAKTVIDVEQNSTAQLARLIRAETGLSVHREFVKYDGRTFLPEEIVEWCAKEGV